MNTTDIDARLDELLAVHHENLIARARTGARLMAQITLTLCPDATGLEISWDMEQLYWGKAIRADGARVDLLAGTGLPDRGWDRMNTASFAMFDGVEHIESWCEGFDDERGNAVLVLERARGTAPGDSLHATTPERPPAHPHTV